MAKILASIQVPIQHSPDDFSFLHIEISVVSPSPWKQHFAPNSVSDTSATPSSLIVSILLYTNRFLRVMKLYF